MKRLGSEILATAGALALGCAAGAGAQPRSVQAGERFELRVGESARVGGAAVELVAVVSDSRCAIGTTCVWEGDGVVSVALRADVAPPAALELHTSARGPREAAAHGWRVRLVALEPHPVAGRTTPSGEYRAALEVERGAAAAGPER